MTAGAGHPLPEASGTELLTDTPDVGVVVRLGEPLAPLLESPAQAAAARTAVAEGLTELLATLGVPGRAAVELAPLRPGARQALLAVAVNDRRCYYPEALLERVLDYVSGMPAGGGRLARARALPAETAANEFVPLAVLEIVKQRAGVLLGRLQARAYARALPGRADPDDEPLSRALREVLNHRISLAARDTVAQVVSAQAEARRSWEELAEDLMAALRTEDVLIHAARSDLKHLSLEQGAGARGLFARVRDELFYELGLRLPRCRWHWSARLKPGSLALQINHLVGLPWTGGLEASRLADELRAAAACLIDVRSVQSELERLARPGAPGTMPVLVRQALERWSPFQITRVLRLLLAEGISMRQLRAILESLVDFDTIRIDASQLVVFDERLPVDLPPDSTWLASGAALTTAVRLGLKHYLGDKYARGRGTLEVYLLDAVLERRLAEHGFGQSRLIDSERDGLCGAVAAALDSPARSATGMPAMLTSLEVRSALREVLAGEFPQLPVLAYQELPPELGLTPLAARLAPENPVILDIARDFDGRGEPLKAARYYYAAAVAAYSAGALAETIAHCRQAIERIRPLAADGSELDQLRTETIRLLAVCAEARWRDGLDSAGAEGLLALLDEGLAAARRIGDQAAVAQLETIRGRWLPAANTEPRTR